MGRIRSWRTPHASDGAATGTVHRHYLGNIAWAKTRDVSHLRFAQ
jgi:hypothetical protein